MNISSVVVKCAPQFLSELLARLKEGDVCEVYAHDENGRIIVIIEGETTEQESEKLKVIQALPHVLSAEMVYAYSQSEFSAEEGKFDKVSESLINSLNSETPAEDIVYQGHLKDR
ncbi:MAG TPA: chaperone NapD [Campylobacterales bacterium]|nr:chaperone NapD [Campylobacterales bacterium]